MSLGLVNPTARIEPCACGGEVVATRLADVEIISAQQRHRLEVVHEAWAVREGLREPLPGDRTSSIEAELARELYGSAVWRSA